MEFSCEERSKRLVERLGRIQNFLQGLPPLPKIDSLGTSDALKEQSRDLDEAMEESSMDEALKSAGSDEDADSVDSSTRRSESTKHSRVIQKDDCGGELLQHSPSLTGMSKHSLLVCQNSKVKVLELKCWSWPKELPLHY